MPNSFHHQAHLNRTVVAPAGMVSRAVRDRYVRPALLSLSLLDQTGEQLLMGTAAIESRFVYLKQFGGGPARGYWQMEPITHDSLWANFLNQARNVHFAEAIKSLLLQGESVSVDSCMTNHKYAAAMARMKYLTCPGSIPASLEDQAHYWKHWYNCSPHGRSEQDYLQVWGRLCAPLYPNFG